MTLHRDPALSLSGNPTRFRACAWVPDRRRTNGGSFTPHQPSKAAVTLPRVPFSAGSGHQRGLRAVRKAGGQRPPALSAGWHGGRALLQCAHKSPASPRWAQSPGKLVQVLSLVVGGPARRVQLCGGTSPSALPLPPDPQRFFPTTSPAPRAFLAVSTAA